MKKDPAFASQPWKLFKKSYFIYFCIGPSSQDQEKDVKNAEFSSNTTQCKSILHCDYLDLNIEYGGLVFQT